MESQFVIPQQSGISEIVKTFWQVQRKNDPLLFETIIPKGLVEIIFSFETTALSVSFNNFRTAIPRCFVQGYHTHPILLQLSNTHTFFGAILNPSSFYHIFKFYPREIANHILDLTLISPLFNSLWHRLGELTSFSERVYAFSNWLMKDFPALSIREKAIDQFLHCHSNTHLSVSDTANQFCLSTKQLSRKFFELTGMNTEQTLLYKKYLHAVHLIHSSELPLTEIAYCCHFSDQSHFIKTFKPLCQLTPKEYRNRKGSIEGHIFEFVH